jgi:hypothetical protein
MKYSILCCLLAVLSACHAQQTLISPAVSPSKPAPTAVRQIDSSPADQSIMRSKLVRWDKTLVDLGPVKKGEKRTLFYVLTNISDKDIQIDIVDACTCTTVEFPRGVIHPGEQKQLDVEFNSDEKDAAETIDIRIIYKQTDPGGNPLLDEVQYKFDLVK